MDSENLSPGMHPNFYEYLLVANPDKSVHEKVTAEKQFFSSEYQQKIAIKTRPHITFANFFAKEPMENTLIRFVENICRKQKSFPVVLNNYSGFPPHTIYLRVQDSGPFQQFAKELKVVNSYVTSCSCPPMKIISNPYISIARGLPEEIYFKALIQYSHKSFHESFIISELILLRRKHRYDTCKTIIVFALKLNDDELPN